MTQDIVLDLDGTLVDSAAICRHIVQTMLAARGRDAFVPESLVRRHISGGGARMIAALLGPACGDPEIEIAEFRRLYAALPTPEGCLYPGVGEGLSTLADQGFRLSICSNKPQKLCDKVLSELGLAGHFAAIIGSMPERPAKPDARLLQLTLHRAGGDPAHALMIGDSGLDAALAENAEVDFVYAAYGYGDCDEQQFAGRTAGCFDDVVGLVLAWRDAPWLRRRPSLRGWVAALT